MENLENQLIENACPHCATAISTNDRFCGHCGKEILVDSLSAVKEDVFTTLTPTLVYYFGTLVLLLLYKATSLFPEGFEGHLIVSVIDVLIVLGFWSYYYEEMRPLLSLKGLHAKVILFTMIGALCGSLFISFLAEIIEVSIRDDVFYNPYLFEDTSAPFFLATLFICFQPALFEEVAFRGFLFTNLRKVTSSMGAVYTTSFIFGIIHLAAISLLWLVPIGVAFAFLRLKYNTLWYGMIGHFTYNFGIILLEFVGWF